MPQTTNSCLLWSSQQLNAIESGDKIARLLLAQVLNQNEAWLWAHPEETVPDELRLRFEELTGRAANHEPLAYLLGYAEFYGQRFEVTPAVLIPRPETEQLVETVLKSARGNKTFPIRHPVEKLSPTPYIVVDVGTGSGCIAITIAKQLPYASVYAIDISPTALEVAKRNASLLKVNNVTFLEGDLLQPLQSQLELHTVDVIVANLPYISDSEFNRLPVNVRAFEPRLALKSNSDDPNRLNKELTLQASSWLKHSGLLAYETTNGRVVEVEF